MAEPDTGRKTCFVAMPVTTPAAYADDLRDADHFGHVLQHLFTPALEQAGYTVIPPKMLGSALIHAEIIRNLEQADLVLADLSNHNPNVFFELGIRTSLDRPVVLVKDARTVMIPFDLGTINVLTYDESLATWTLDEEITRLADHVSSVPTDNASGNAMWRYFGLTKRGGPAEAGSLEAKVDLLLAEITKLRLAPRGSVPMVDEPNLVSEPEVIGSIYERHVAAAFSDLGYSVAEQSYDSGYDLTVENAGKRIAIEIKYSRAPIQTAMIARDVMLAEKVALPVLIVANRALTTEAAKTLASHPGIGFALWRDDRDNDNLKAKLIVLGIYNP